MILDWAKLPKKSNWFFDLLVLPSVFVFYLILFVFVMEKEEVEVVDDKLKNDGCKRVDALQG